MRSYEATNSNDVAEAKRLRAKPWMLEALALNPRYVSYLWSATRPGWS